MGRRYSEILDAKLSEGVAPSGPSISRKIQPERAADYPEGLAAALFRENHPWQAANPPEKSTPSGAPAIQRYPPRAGGLLPGKFPQGGRARFSDKPRAAAPT